MKKYIEYDLENKNGCTLPKEEVADIIYDEIIKII